MPAPVPVDLEDQLLRDEGERLAAYQDSQGYWTIGIGRLIDARKGGGISHDEALMLLRNDLQRVDAQLQEHLPWTLQLDPVRRDAIRNMCFNLGIAGLMEFHHTLSALQRSDWSEAADDMLASRWAQQVGSRAQRLACQVRTGQYR